MPAPRHTRSGYRPRSPQRRRRRGGWGIRLSVLGVLLLLIAGGFGALAVAASSSDGLAPEGATVGGVDVGGMSRAEAMGAVERQVVRPAMEPVAVEVAGKTFRLTAKTGKFSVDYETAVDRAIASGGQGSFVTRGWAKLTGSSRGTAQAVAADVDRKAVSEFVDRIADGVEVSARDASLDISLTSVDVTDSQPGRELAGRKQLRRQVVRKVRNRRANRTIAAETKAVEPEVTRKALLADTPTVVTVDKGSTTVRVFKGGKLDKTYSVAIGADGYDTPEGQFSVQSMQVDPPWNVPQSEWAGDLAGQVIPGGAANNPLVARWIGFNGAVGFHGTREAGSIGTAASKGCVRMSPPDVIDLYERVQSGTPVLVA